MNTALVVGAGVMGSIHQRTLISLGFKTITADPYADADYPSQLAAPSAEVVCIATPPSQLCIEAEQAIARGAETILIEKPFALDLGEAQNVIDLAERYGVNVGVGYVERGNEAVGMLKERIAEVGTVESVKASRLGPAPGRPTAGPTLDLLSHDLDVARYVGLQPEAVIASRVDDRKAWASVKLADGEAEFEASYDQPSKIRTIKVTGNRGSLEVDYQMQTINGYANLGRPLEPLRVEWLQLLKGEPLSTPRDALGTLSLALTVNANGD